MEREGEEWDMGGEWTWYARGQKWSIEAEGLVGKTDNAEEKAMRQIGGHFRSGPGPSIAVENDMIVALPRIHYRYTMLIADCNDIVSHQDCVPELSCAHVVRAIQSPA